MPILTETTPPRKRRLPVCALILAVPWVVFHFLVWRLMNATLERPLVIATPQHKMVFYRRGWGDTTMIDLDPSFQHREIEVPGIPRLWLYFDLTWR